MKKIDLTYKQLRRQLDREELIKKAQEKRDRKNKRRLENERRQGRAR